MKPHHLLAGLACLLIGSAALAQSSVSLYGRVNLTVERQNRNGVNKAAEQDNTSRFGMRGVEDLGNGVKAGFQLESGFAADTGVASGISANSATFWNRNSSVFVGSSKLGTIRLGRVTADSYFATADFVSKHNHDTGTSGDALYSSFQRTNNSIIYRSGEWVPGLDFTLNTTLGEGTSKQVRDVAVNYQVGGLALGLGYSTFITAAATTLNETAKQLALRAYYTVGPFGFGGYVQRDRDAFGVGERTNVRLSGMYTLGASEFHLNAGSAGKTGNIANSKAMQYTVAYNYNLSKRTKVYTFFTRVNDSAAALYGGDFRSLAAGIRHNF